MFSVRVFQYSALGLWKNWNMENKCATNVICPIKTASDIKLVDFAHWNEERSNIGQSKVNEIVLNINIIWQIINITFVLNPNSSLGF